MRYSLALLFVAVPGLANSLMLSHEGRLLRADGRPAAGLVNLTFAIYASPSGGTPVWSEQRSVALSGDGHYALLLGEVHPLPLFPPGDWWLGVTVAGEPEMAPRARLGASAFALHAIRAQSVLAAEASGTLGVSLGQWMRVATVQPSFQARLRVEWTTATAQGSLVLAAGKHEDYGQPQENSFRIESLQHHDPAVFTHFRVAKGASGYFMELFVPSGTTPGTVVLGLLEGTGIALTPPAYATTATTPVFEVALEGLTFAVGAGDARALSLTSTGNVGVGTTRPQARLHIEGGALRIGSRNVASQVTVCTYDNPSHANASGLNARQWAPGECDNGLPAGTCMGFLSRAVACGQDEDWRVLTPGEQAAGAGPFTNGGMAWWVSSPCPSTSMRAVYFCH